MLFKRPFSLRRAPDLVAEPERLDLRAAALRFLDEMAVATFVLDREHRVIVWNKACARLTGLDATAVIGTRDHWKGFYNLPRPCLVDLVLSGDTASVGAHYAGHARQTGGAANLSAENWCDLPKGARLYLGIEACPILDETGAIVAAVETLHDMSALKSAEKAIAGERAGVLTTFGEALEKLAA